MFYCSGDGEAHAVADVVELGCPAHEGSVKCSVLFLVKWGRPVGARLSARCCGVMNAGLPSPVDAVVGVIYSIADNVDCVVVLGEHANSARVFRQSSEVGVDGDDDLCIWC